VRKIDLTNFQLATSGTAREINRRIALNFIRRHAPLSRADLARSSGLQPSTVSAIIDELIGEGWVTEGIGRAPRGRRPRLLHLNVERAGIVAVDLRPEIDHRRPGRHRRAVRRSDARGAPSGIPRRGCRRSRRRCTSSATRIRGCCVKGSASACRDGRTPRAG
jgi:hypothetical protein